MNHPLPYFYETEIEWKGERRGRLRHNKLPPLEVSPPPEFQGSEGMWTLEHLYVSSVSACFMITFLAIAQSSKLEVVSFCASAKGKLEKIDGLGYQMTEIVLKPRLVIRNSRDLERAARILEKAEKNCLLSNSVRTTVKVEPEVYHQQTPVSPCPAVAEAPSGK